MNSQIKNVAYQGQIQSCLSKDHALEQPQVQASWHLKINPRPGKGVIKGLLGCTKSYRWDVLPVTNIGDDGSNLLINKASVN